MNFKIVDSKEIVEYLSTSLKKTESRERKKNIKTLIKGLMSGQYYVLFGFENEYGESYLVVGNQLGNYAWCGDESDWGFARSFYEDEFVNHIMSKKNRLLSEAKKSEITDIKF